MRQPFEAAIRQSQRAHEPGVLIGVRSICAYTRIGPNTFYQMVSEAWVSRHAGPWWTVDYQQAID
jgi:hypothetical protein